MNQNEWQRLADGIFYLWLGYIVTYVVVLAIVFGVVLPMLGILPR